MFVKIIFIFSTLFVSVYGECLQGVNCTLPLCFCPTKRHPYFPNVSNIPQMVFFGFDDAVTGLARKYYDRLFTAERKNPNECPIHMSLYISDANTIYSNVKTFYEAGHEVAVHSVTHTKIDTREKVLDEGKRQRDNIVRYAGVNPEDVIGWRSPFLNTAGDDQVAALQTLNYTYDISLTYLRRNQRDPGFWPMTLDFKWPTTFSCQIPPCPTKKHEGFWEVPVNSMRDFKDDYSCGYVDGCYNRPSNFNEAYKYLMDNFMSYYRGNRAPFGLSMHYAWFMTPYNLEAMDKFITDILAYDDVYILSVKEILEWMKNPVGLDKIGGYKPWNCGNEPKTRSITTTTSPPTTTPTTATPTTTTQTTRKTTTSTPKPFTRTKHPTTTTGKKTTEKQATETTQGTDKPNLVKDKFTPQVKKSTEGTKPTTQRPVNVAKPIVNRIPHDVGNEKCQQGHNCFLPHCYCASIRVPGNLPLQDTPQMVYITFEGNLNNRIFQKVKALLSGSNRFRNPNNCPMNATFFLSGRTPFTILQELAKTNMEIAMIGFSGRKSDNQQQLAEEITLELQSLSNIMIEPKGWRSPDLKPLGDGQYTKLLKYGLDYDATLTIPTSSRKINLWPYTLDFGVKEQCVIEDCPKKAYPGLWEVHHEPVIDYEGKYPCNFIDGCFSTPPTADDTFQFLWNNFVSHYKTNKAPFGIHMRSLWFSHSIYQYNLDGVEKFLYELNRLPDVYVMPIQEIITWMKKPKPLNIMSRSSC